MNRSKLGRNREVVDPDQRFEGTFTGFFELSDFALRKCFRVDAQAFGRVSTVMSFRKEVGNPPSPKNEG